MSYTVKVVTTVSIATWIRVDGLEDQGAAVIEAEMHAANMAATRYGPVDTPIATAEAVREVDGPATDTVVCVEVPSPEPAPPPPPKPVRPEPKAEASDEQPAPKANPNHVTMDKKHLSLLIHLQRACEHYEETGDDSGISDVLGDLKRLQVSVPLPQDLLLIGVA